MRQRPFTQQKVIRFHILYGALLWISNTYLDFMLAARLLSYKHDMKIQWRIFEKMNFFALLNNGCWFSSCFCTFQWIFPYEFKFGFRDAVWIALTIYSDMNREQYTVSKNTQYASLVPFSGFTFIYKQRLWWMYVYSFIM